MSTEFTKGRGRMHSHSVFHSLRSAGHKSQVCSRACRSFTALFFCLAYRPSIFVWLTVCTSAFSAVALAQQLQPTDTLRALVLFVQFQDDFSPGDSKLGDRGWPVFDDRTMLPAHARTLLAPSPHPPYPDTSLTAYFHQQSLGQFVLYGEPYPEVLLTEQPEAQYHHPNGGYGHLTKELLDRLDGEGFDFTRFDHNRDGWLDYLFILLRRDSLRDAKRITFTGISCLDARCGGGPVGGRPPDELMYDDVRVHWMRSGSILFNRLPGNIAMQMDLVRLMAHEIGHDLWADHFVHIPPLTDNDVPWQSNRGRATAAQGYALMVGAGGGPDHRGDYTVSAFERDLLSWVDCAAPSADTTLILGDLYMTSDCAKWPIPHRDGTRWLYATNRQRIGPFDRYRKVAEFEIGLLRTTGLLVTLSEDTRFDVLPADGGLTLATSNAPYHGDLFGPATQRQLTPWTRPSFDGYRQYPKGYTPTWQAIDEIEVVGPERQMQVGYIHDFRMAPVIRADSWIGDETEGHTFTQSVSIEEGATLHIDTQLTFTHHFNLGPGSTLIIGPDAEVTLTESAVLRVSTGSRIVVKGVLSFRGLLIPQGPFTLEAPGVFRRSIR
ncbi:MAG: hypothetical protein RhofKO_28690 [Rhodothermales bacterium]